jgi:hypothetical protein
MCSFDAKFKVEIFLASYIYHCSPIVGSFSTGPLEDLFTHLAVFGTRTAAPPGEDV